MKKIKNSITRAFYLVLGGGTQETSYRREPDSSRFRCSDMARKVENSEILSGIGL